jgi:flagellar hook-length control protein FliK
MISNVAPKSTEAVSSAAPAGETADTGDTGAFDALLAIVGEDTVTEVSAQLAGALEGGELSDLLDDPDDLIADDAEVSADDALSFLTALLPLPQKPVTPDVAGTSPSTATQNDALPAAAGGATLLAAGAGVAGNTDDLAKALLISTDATGKDSKLAGNAAAAIDTTTWNSMTGPAEMFAHAARHTPERIESAPLTTHVRDPRWADDLGNRLASMVRTGESSASLQLTPVDLGPLEVNVAVRDNQATVHFGAANAETRALLEASIPRLREMLASQGFQLMDSSVSHGFARQTRHESAGTPRVDALGESPTAVATLTHITGLLDLYA